MNEEDIWVMLDGPEPAWLSPHLEVLRDVLPPVTTEDTERAVERFFAALDAAPPCEPALVPADVREAVLASPCSLSAVLPPNGIPPTVLFDLPEKDRAEAGKLPFKPPSTDRPTPVIPKTMPVPVMGMISGATLPSDDDTIARALAKVLPFAGNTVGAGVVPFPRLKLEEYASLRAELTVEPEPERAEAILLKYHVLSEPSKEALIADWDRRLRANPGEKADFEARLGTYVAWLRQVRRR